MEIGATALAIEVLYGVYKTVNLRYECLVGFPLEAEIRTKLNSRELTLFVNYCFARLVARRLRGHGSMAPERSVCAYRSKFSCLTKT